MEQERSKYPTQAAVGLRFTGMRVWQPGHGSHKEHGRAFGYALSEATLHHALYEYLHDGERLRVELIPPLLQRVEAVREWFLSQAEFRFYGSSLLFVYEGDPVVADAAQPGGTGAGGDPAGRVDVRMIDFAHVWPIRDGPHGRDTGYLLGLDSLLRCLRHVATEHAALGGDSKRGAQ